jgi:SlyX protein
MRGHEAADAASRIQALEERLTFQQRLLEELNAVVLQQGRRIDQAAREAARLAAAVDRLSAAVEGDLPHEKPPHY